MKHAKMVLGFLSTTLPQAASRLTSNISETIKDPKHWGPGSASVVGWLISEGWLVKKLKDCKNMALKDCVGDSLKHFILSIASGGFAGGAAYLSGLSDQDQAQFIGLVIAALNLTIADVRVLFRARQDMRRAPDSYLLFDPSSSYSAPINEESENKLTPLDSKFAKKIQNNILAKLPFLYLAGGVIYGATSPIKEKTHSDDNYFTDHAGQMALALPIAGHRIWSVVTSYLVKPPEPISPVTFGFN